LGDLKSRLELVRVDVPPLRDRVGDVWLLAKHFLGENWQMDAAALRVLESYTWPGNVAQLSHVLERAKLLASGNMIRAADLPAELAPVPTAAPSEVPSRFTFDNLSVLERTKVSEVLARERGNKSRAARALGIDRRKLYRLIEKYNLLPASAAHEPRNGHSLLHI
jgi:DNA-binding NtrC family response regulator